MLVESSHWISSVPKTSFFHLFSLCARKPEILSLMVAHNAVLSESATENLMASFSFALCLLFLIGTGSSFSSISANSSSTYGCFG